MENLVHLRIWGDLACFTRPEAKVERVSYPVITPSAARGVLEAILYRPGFRWEIRRVAVKRKIQFLSFQRNELKSRAKSTGSPVPIVIQEDRTQRNTLALRDVEYVIEAAIILREGGLSATLAKSAVAKYRAMAIRRIENGQCFTHPFFGCREFAAFFERSSPSAMIVQDRLNPDAVLGRMLYDVFDLDRSQRETRFKPAITFFQAELREGIVSIPSWDEVKVQWRDAP